MKFKSVLITSSLLLIFNIIVYQLKLPEWLHPISILFYINCIIILYYHKDSVEIKIPETPLNSSEKSQIKELEIAKRVQQALLEVETPHIEGIKIAKRCIPAMTLGGDFYTFISNSVQSLSNKSKTPGVIQYHDTEENILGIAIGDVAGHGVSSALVMALSFGILGKIGQRITSPGKVLKRANEDIRKFITSSQISHVTAIYSVFHPESKKFTYASAGHNPALLIKQNDLTIHELYTQGSFLGMYPNESYEEHETQLYSGDRIILYTDGIIEPTNSSNEMYGEQRLKSCLETHLSEDIDLLIDIILNNVKEFSGKPSLKDDQTIIILEIL